MKRIVLFIAVSVAAALAADQCSTVPPTLWCASDKLAKECGVLEHCERYRKEMLNKPIKLTVLIEALCPDCQNWIVETLYPKIYKNFAGFVDIEFVPYGNAKQNGSIECQHGPEECQINKFESCLIDSVQTQDKYVPLIYCLESQLKAGISFDKATAKCFRTYNVDEGEQRMIQSCLVSKVGTRLQEKAAERTANVWPEKHTSVPWVLFNNVSLGSAQLLMDDIPSLICQWYIGEKRIPYCGAQEKKMYKQRTQI